VSAKILLADDEPDLLEPVAYALRRHGFDVTTVPDGEGAMREALLGGYELLICDVLMPGTLGTDVTRKPLHRASTRAVVLFTTTPPR
jgi:DNA-binding response OmpR family regulator